MNRLQKKCVIASMGFHLLLVVILLIGPAFLMSSSKTVSVPLMEIISIPDKTTDEMVSGGGPKSTPAPALPTPPLPTPPAPPVQTPQTQPVQEPPKPVKPVVEPTVSTEPSTKPTQRKPNISTTIVDRKPDKKPTQQSDANAKAAAEQKRQLVAAFDSAARGIRTGIAPSTTVKVGDGTGGATYANFNSVLKKIYMDAWLVPDGVTADSTVVQAEVTIARDGDVISTRIVKRSGNPVVDQSVEEVLRRVRHTVPLPESSSDSQRSVILTFDVKAKLLG